MSKMTGTLALILSGIVVASVFTPATSSPSEEKREQDIEETGDVLQLLIPAAAYTTTFILDDREGRRQFYKSLLVNIGVTYGLKLSIDKDRPEGHGDFAFPSAHTSSAFQGATFLQRRYGWKYGVPAYVAAAFVGFSREEADKHDQVDVLSGAVIGIVSGYLLASPRKDASLAPVASDGFYGLTIEKKW
jgi:membrane-associated phospholipid phosphatase